MEARRALTVLPSHAKAGATSVRVSTRFSIDIDRPKLAPAGAAIVISILKEAKEQPPSRVRGLFPRTLGRGASAGNDRQWFSEVVKQLSQGTCQRRLKTAPLWQKNADSKMTPWDWGLIRA